MYAALPDHDHPIPPLALEIEKIDLTLKASYVFCRERTRVWDGHLYCVIAPDPGTKDEVTF